MITKRHYPSYAFDLSDDVLAGLVFASRDVAKILDAKLDDVGRTALVFEGFGVDHMHAKLFPLHGTKADHWEPRHSAVDKYFARYEGYISSHDYQRADDEALADLTKKIQQR